MTTKLVDALRKKYPDARSALRALGLDENLLSDDGDLLRRNSQKVVDQLLKLFGTTQKASKKLGMDEAMLTEPEHMPSDPRGNTGGTYMGGQPRTGGDRFGLRRSSRDEIPKKVEEMPAENLSSGWHAEDDEPDGLEPFRDRMREHGLSEDEVEEACELARDHVRRRGANGRDKHADDFMPINRVRGGAPGRFGGERQGRRADGGSEVEAARAYARQIGSGDQMETPDNQSKFLVDHGLDARRHLGGMDSSRQEINEIHRLMKRFGPEVGCCPERYRGAKGAVPSMARQARIEARYPGLSRIQQA